MIDGAAEVKRQLDLVVQSSEKEIEAMRRRVLTHGSAAEADLSELLNNYAWLVANTEGDYQKALKFSLESLTIRTDGAKYDTCARCYFAVGDIENAIATQKKAIKLLRHSPPLERQLAEFQKGAGSEEVEDCRHRPPACVSNKMHAGGEHENHLGQ